MIRAFLLQLSLYTILYSPEHEWDVHTYQRGISFVPLIGLLLGLILYGVSMVIAPFMASFFLVLLYCILSGGLHLDGFADTLDGVLARRGAKRALEIMKDPHLGTFGILGLLLLLLAYYNFFPLLGRSLLLLPALGRFGGMLSGYKNTYVRSEGMGKLFIHSLHTGPVLFWSLALMGLSFILGPAELISSLTAFLFAFSGGRWFKKYLGGLSGDCIGFIIEATQLSYILTLLVVRLWI